GTWYVTANMTSRLALGDACNLVFSGQSNSSIHLSDANWVAYGLEENFVVADTICNGEWRWPGEWVDRFDAIFAIDPPNIDNDRKHKVVWGNGRGRCCNFSVSNVWEDLRIRSQIVPWATIEFSSTGMYERLPKCTKDVGIHSTLTDKQQKPVLKKLNTLVTWNYLKLHYPNSSSRLKFLMVLVGETSGPVKLEETRRFVLRDDLECKMAASDTPFTTLYTILHEFCVPLIMDTIIRQIQALRIGRWKDTIWFELISDGNQGQGGSASSVQTSQDGEANFVSLRTPGDKILYWLESEKNSRHYTVSCPFNLKIVTRYTRLLEIYRELGENSHIRRAEGDVLLHTGLNELGSEYNKVS
ncbi:mediator of RNA polymerase II transcription subunit 14, partial [Tanacetum coccineum]